MSTFSDMFGALPGFLNQGVKAVTDVATAVSDAKFGWASRSLDVKLKNAQINSVNNQIQLQALTSNTQLEIAKLSAQNQLTMAQQGYYGIGSLNADNINQALANLGTQVSGGSSGGGIMLWLTVAGVGIAAYQLIKGKK